MALETASPREFPGATPREQLQAFRTKILAKSSLKLTEGARLAASYGTRLGVVLECAYDGEDRINGAPLDYKDWPLSESPWTSRRMAHDPLTVTDGKTERIYDFVKWTITQRTK